MFKNKIENINNKLNGVFECLKNIDIEKDKKFKDLKEEIKELKNKIWILENPHVFNIGDIIKMQKNGLIPFVKDDILDYKIIGKKYKKTDMTGHGNYLYMKVYEIIDCKTCDRFFVEEKELLNYNKK